MNDVVPIRKSIPPKEERFTHGGQTFICRYDPIAPPEHRWVWVLDYTRSYKYFGNAATLVAAQSQARRRIVKLNKRVVAGDEHDMSSG